MPRWPFPINILDIGGRSPSHCCPTGSWEEAQAGSEEAPDTAAGAAKGIKKQKQEHKRLRRDMVAKAIAIVQKAQACEDKNTIYPEQPNRLLLRHLSLLLHSA